MKLTGWTLMEIDATPAWRLERMLAIDDTVAAARRDVETAGA